MKKIFTLLFSFSSLTALAQNNVATDTTRNPTTTEKGKPDGENVEIIIGKEGGTLFSFDRKVELIVPARAVSKKTTFSIQPISNTSPNKEGWAYRIEPSGILFQQPVQLVFHYTNNEETDSLKLLKGIATQDDSGHWHRLENFVIDTIAKTLSGNVEHFCDMAVVNAIDLHCDRNSLKVKSSELLDVMVSDPRLVKTIVYKYSVKWYVNGIQNGNAKFGWIKIIPSQHYGGIETMETVRYFAPALVPDNNPVNIKAVIQDVNFEVNGQIIKNLIKQVNIMIYDKGYRIVVQGIIKDDAGTRLGKVEHFDESEFLISLKEDKGTIMNIINRNEVLNYTGKCKIEILNPNTNSGIINVGKLKGIKVTPANPPGQPDPIIEIEFVTAYPVFSEMSITCPDASDPFITPMMKLPGMPTLPARFKFIAKEGDQVQEMGKRNSPLYFSITIQKLSDEVGE